MISITAHDEGVTIPVYAQPNAKKNAIVGEHAAALKISVTAPPEDGKANAAILEVLRIWLGLRRQQLELLHGQAQRKKIILVKDVTVEELVCEIAAKLLT